MADVPHFITSSGTWKLLFSQPLGPSSSAYMAMADTCCCDLNGFRPGYAIYARDCCSGEINDELFLDLTHPPTHAYTRIFYDPDTGTCVRFDPRDVATAVLMSDPSFTGTRDFLALGFYSWNRYSKCSECRCDHGGDPCCYDFINYPNATIRSGQETYEYSGLQLHSAVQPCRSTVVLLDPVDGALLYCKVELPDGLPTGPYTKDGCDPEITPNLYTITSYWKDSGCSVPSARPSDIEPITVSWDYVGLGGYAAQTGNAGIITNNRVFDIVYAGLIPSPLCEPITIPNPVTSEGTDAGFGGSVTITPCCPDEPGGI